MTKGITVIINTVIKSYKLKRIHRYIIIVVKFPKIRFMKRMKYMLKMSIIGERNIIE